MCVCVDLCGNIVMGAIVFKAIVLCAQCLAFAQSKATKYLFYVQYKVTPCLNLIQSRATAFLSFDKYMSVFSAQTKATWTPL